MKGFFGNDEGGRKGGGGRKGKNLTHCVIQGCLSTIILSIDKGEAECGRKGAKEGIGTGRAAVEGSAV